MERPQGLRSEPCATSLLNAGFFILQLGFSGTNAYPRVSEAWDKFITIVLGGLGFPRELLQNAILGVFDLGGRNFAFCFPEHCGQGSKLP